MPDNGKELNQEKPKQENQLIFKMEVTPDKRFVFQVCTGHVPTLCFGHKMLGVEIDKMIISQKMKNQTEASKIIKSAGGIMDFVRRGNRR